jgi:hypothetical protein
MVNVEEVLYKRLVSEDDLYILQFDLSDNINDIIVNNFERNALRLIKSRFSVTSSKIANNFRPIVEKWVFAVRLIAEKIIVDNFIKEAISGTI